MRIADLVAAYPRLYHMAEDGSWPSIHRHGLLSTRALLDLYQVPAVQRRLLEARRPDSVELQHIRLGRAVVRDNKPMSDTKLANALVGMTTTQWYRLLNGMVFFWVREERLRTLLSARAYRDRPHTVLTLDTRRLLDRYASRVRLSPINSGSTAYVAVARGRSTFSAIRMYPYAERRAARGADAIVELAVLHAVASVERYLVRVERWQQDERLERLWP
jgi:hypothetical protein